MTAGDSVDSHESRPWPPVRMSVGSNVVVDLCTEENVVAIVHDRLTGHATTPVAIGSVNLDHLHHFAKPVASPDVDLPGPDWLMLADGAPIVRQANRLTGGSWPRLTGADLLERFLAEAESTGSSVAFLGGQVSMHDNLRPILAQRFPALRVVGYWAPERADIEDPIASAALAETIRAARPDVVIVGLGKPRQEAWIDRFGVAAGASVYLAFGAAADFLAGTVSRAPHWMRRFGLEWLYRFIREPRRLGRRYLVEGPLALLHLRGAALIEDRR